MGFGLQIRQQPLEYYISFEILESEHHESVRFCGLSLILREQVTYANIWSLLINCASYASLLIPCKLTNAVFRLARRFDGDTCTTEQVPLDAH